MIGMQRHIISQSIIFYISWLEIVSLRIDKQAGYFSSPKNDGMFVSRNAPPSHVIQIKSFLWQRERICILWGALIRILNILVVVRGYKVTCCENNKVEKIWQARQNFAITVEQNCRLVQSSVLNVGQTWENTRRILHEIALRIIKSFLKKWSKKKMTVSVTL